MQNDYCRTVGEEKRLVVCYLSIIAAALGSERYEYLSRCHEIGV